VRHGRFPRPEHVASAHLPLPLSEEGRAEARAAVEPLIAAADALDLQIDATLEASRLLRATETAWILAEGLEAALGRPFRVEERDELLERGLGSCANLRFDQIETLLGQDPRLPELPAGWRRMPDFRLPVPGAESLLTAGRRTAARIDESLAAMDPADGSDRLRIFVAHGGCLRHAAVAKGVLEIERVPTVTMDYVQSVFFEREPDGDWTQIAGEWKKRLPSTTATPAADDRANQEPQE
jgi:2,3-bisphosphoglycerate-dependent phosphoglycerate mutase